MNKKLMHFSHHLQLCGVLLLLFSALRADGAHIHGGHQTGKQGKHQEQKPGAPHISHFFFHRFISSLPRSATAKRDRTFFIAPGGAAGPSPETAKTEGR